MVSFLATLPASGSITVSFVDQPSGNNTGQMTSAALLAFNWGAEIDVTNGTTLSANARKIVTDWSGNSGDPRVTYWLQGSICTQVILEDRTPALAYDMGWDANKPLHPIFVVTFYPTSSAGAKVEMILENDWDTKREDQTYSLNLQVGNPLASVYTKANFTHLNESRWRKIFWSGTQPGAVAIDYNLPYMISSMAVPNWDLSKTVPAGAVNADVNGFNASDQCDLGGHGQWTQNMSTTGARPDIGVFPAWYVRYLYTMDPRLYTSMVGLAECSAHVPIHRRESGSGLFYDSARTIDAFGMPISVDARGAAVPNPIGTVTFGGWTYDLGHAPGFAYIPYLITGDWYFLEELQFLAASASFGSTPGWCSYCRGGNTWGYLSFSVQTRGQAWGLRDIGQAAFTAPDGSPQKAYFTQHLNNNIEIEEGEQGITNGAFPPPDPNCTGYVAGTPATVKWCFGNKTLNTVPDQPTQPLHNTLNFPNYGDPQGNQNTDAEMVLPAGNNEQCLNDNSPWMYGYKWNVMGHLQELGFSVGPLNQVQFKFLLHMILDPASNPWLVAAYRQPVIRQTTGDYYQTWADVLAGYNPTYSCPGSSGAQNLQTYQGWYLDNCPQSGAGDSNTGAPGYPHIMKGAASYLAGLSISDGALSGLTAWNWMAANVGFQNGIGANPQFAVLPRGVQTGPPPSSPCDMNGDGSVDVLDVQIAINQALGLAPCTNSDLQQNGTCTVIDVQRVINAALGGACVVGP